MRRQQSEFPHHEAFRKYFASRADALELLFAEVRENSFGDCAQAESYLNRYFQLKV